MYMYSQYSVTNIGYMCISVYVSLSRMVVNLQLSEYENNVIILFICRRQ